MKTWYNFARIPTFMYSQFLLCKVDLQKYSMMTTYRDIFQNTFGKNDKRIYLQFCENYKHIFIRSGCSMNPQMISFVRISQNRTFAGKSGLTAWIGRFLLTFVSFFQGEAGTTITSEVLLLRLIRSFTIINRCNSCGLHNRILSIRDIRQRIARILGRRWGTSHTWSGKFQTQPINQVLF